MGNSKTLVLITILACFRSSIGVELTFELAENSHECFYEAATQGSSVSLEFQVIDGGSYDVDVVVRDPAGRTLYKQDRTQYDSVTFTAAENGTYVVCFGNEFSTFSHKLVYMDLEVDDVLEVTESHDHPTATAMTQMEASAQEIQEALRIIVDHQTHHRLRETQSRKRAEDFRDRVFWWSLAETLAIFFVSISQVYIVKMFFAYRNPLPFARP